MLLLRLLVSGLHVRVPVTRPPGLLWFFVAWLLAVAVHEAGHLAFGALMGMRPILYVVGPLRVIRAGERMRVGYNSNLATWGGLAAAMPQDARDLNRRMAWMIAGGPLSSLGLGVAAALSIPLLAFPAFALALVSMLIFVATLLPIRVSGYRSDGAQLLDYLRGGPEVERRALLIFLSGASLAGQRPRELDPSLLTRALQLDGSTAGRAAAVFFATTASVDRGAPDPNLFAELGSLHDAYPEGFRQNIALWMAWYASARQRDQEAAGSWLALGKGGIVDPVLRDLAEASVARLRGDRAASESAVARGLARKPGMDVGAHFLLRDLLETMKTPPPAGADGGASKRELSTRRARPSAGDIPAAPSAPHEERGSPRS